MLIFSGAVLFLVARIKIHAFYDRAANHAEKMFIPGYYYFGETDELDGGKSYYRATILHATNDLVFLRYDWTGKSSITYTSSINVLLIMREKWHAPTNN